MLLEKQHEMYGGRIDWACQGKVIAERWRGAGRGKVMVEQWRGTEKSSLTLERQERVLGAAEGEYEFAAIPWSLIKLFPDTIIRQEK